MKLQFNGIARISSRTAHFDGIPCDDGVLSFRLLSPRPIADGTHMVSGHLQLVGAETFCVIASGAPVNLPTSLSVTGRVLAKQMEESSFTVSCPDGDFAGQVVGVFGSEIILLEAITSSSEATAATAAVSTPPPAVTAPVTPSVPAAPPVAAPVPVVNAPPVPKPADSVAPEPVDPETETSPVIAPLLPVVKPKPEVALVAEATVSRAPEKIVTEAPPVVGVTPTAPVIITVAHQVPEGFPVDEVLEPGLVDPEQLVEAEPKTEANGSGGTTNLPANSNGATAEPKTEPSAPAPAPKPEPAAIKPPATVVPPVLPADAVETPRRVVRTLSEKPRGGVQPQAKPTPTPAGAPTPAPPAKPPVPPGAPTPTPPAKPPAVPMRPPQSSSQSRPASRPPGRSSTPPWEEGGQAAATAEPSAEEMRTGNGDGGEPEVATPTSKPATPAAAIKPPESLLF